ncbi:hypothetical protein AVEN_88700-1 [Araneus ventricosus]|uniref:Integrase catalytic domain-containing protein n=1 Tax=Araneus ventricosus TaxID=182803 RepID=A0A4Y2VHS4_ARAVE|nr:hypothetical protein AVEN_88700-1 [Araneus ventricosus]
MNQGVLYRYSHDSESEEAQLVVPTHERDKILKEHHDSLNAADYGSDGTYQIIAKRYFLIVQAPRFETIAIDLFGPLPESKNKKKWICIVEDVATRLLEPFALTNATARECATVLMQEVFLRFGLPRKVSSATTVPNLSPLLCNKCVTF